MPKPTEFIEQGIRYESGGVLDRALNAYRAAAAAAVDDPPSRIEALRREADVLRSRCLWDEAVARAQESAELARTHGHDTLLAEALNAEAAVYQSRGDLDRAHALYTEMLGLTDDLRIRGIALQNLGSIAAMRGDFRRAEERFVESFQCFQAGGYKRGVVFALNNYGRAALDRKADAIAHPVLHRAEIMARELMDLDLLGIVRINLAESHLRHGDIDRAQDLASAALGYFGNTSNHWRRLECLRLLGDIAVAQLRAESARNFFEAALRVATEIGSTLEADTLQRRLDSLQPA
ncbi:MAG: tetratricopeptide repeat protein [Longimicrobiales bacterium]